MGRVYSDEESDIEEEDEDDFEEDEYEEEEGGSEEFELVDHKEVMESERTLSSFSQQRNSPYKFMKVETHPIFREARLDSSTLQKDILEGSRPRIHLNLVAYDGHGRVFVWDSEHKELLFVEIQRSDLLHSSADDGRVLLAREVIQTITLSSPVDFQVLHLSLNRTGRCLVLAGDSSLMLVNLLPPSSTSSSGVCRVQRIGADGLFSRASGQWMRILQIAWHPYSDCHLGVLSSDGCLRLFDLSLDTQNAEQEFHLQPQSPINSGSSPLVRAVAFAFGGEHLWDRFTVFILYNNGSLYAICPVVPFGGMYNVSAVEELVKHAEQSETVDSPSLLASTRSSLAGAWLDAVFPGLRALDHGSQKESAGGSLILKAYAYVPLDASLHLQGPFATLSRRIRDDGHDVLEQMDLESCQAIGLLYNVVGKDSVLAISTLDGQVELYVLADEMEPTWAVGKPSRVSVDDNGHILAVGMLVEASDTVQPFLIGREEELRRILQGQIPPLLRLASVDLALQRSVLEAGPVVLFTDPIVPERLYCQHASGIDAIILQWLPFSAQSAHQSSTGVPPPAVFPLLDVYPTGFTNPRPLLGVALISDSLGESWILAVTSNCECAVVNVKPRRALPEPVILEERGSPDLSQGEVDVGVFQMMSKDLLQGPKDIPITQLTSAGTPLTTESIEGRAFIHDHCKLLREKYIEYSHRVYVELTSNLKRLHTKVQEQIQQVRDVDLKLRQTQQGSISLSDRIQSLMLKNRVLEERVKRSCSRLGVSEKPLTASEQELKAQLDNMRFQDIDILNSAVETLSLRAERLFRKQSNDLSGTSPSWKRHDRYGVPDSQMRRLKVAVEHLTSAVEESTAKVKVIEETINNQELLRGR